MVLKFNPSKCLVLKLRGHNNKVNKTTNTTIKQQPNQQANMKLFLGLIGGAVATTWLWQNDYINKDLFKRYKPTLVIEDKEKGTKKEISPK